LECVHRKSVQPFDDNIRCFQSVRHIRRRDGDAFHPGSLGTLYAGYRVFEDDTLLRRNPDQACSLEEHRWIWFARQIKP
jgi:hypothetical protein